MANGVPMGWDDVFEDEGSITLTEGEYYFRIDEVKFDHNQRHNCPELQMRLSVDNGRGQLAKVREWLPLLSTLQWKVCSLFTSTGLREHGAKGKLPWQNLQGQIGYAKFTVGDKGYNQVERYLDAPPGMDPPPALMYRAQPQPQPQQPQQPQQVYQGEVVPDDPPW